MHNTSTACPANLTRRGFVSGAAALGATATAASLLAGSAVAEEAASDEAEAAEPGEVLDDNAADASTDGLLYTASINPQD